MPNTRGGRFGTCSFVLAVVKREEISGYLKRNASIRALSRIYDRNEDTIERAVAYVKAMEEQGADINTVARDVWRDKVGWETSGSYLTAMDHISRGKLIPKEKRGKRKTKAKESVSQLPTSIDPVPSVMTATPAPVENPVRPSPNKKPLVEATGAGVIDDLFADAPLLHQVHNVATRGGRS